MTDFSKAYRCRFALMKVDGSTWTENGEVRGFVSASVKRSDGIEYESGSITAEQSDDVTGYRRIVAYVEQDGGIERHDISTLLLEETSGNTSNGVVETAYVGRSVLYPANAMGMPPGSYVSAGSDGATYAAKMLSRCIKAPINVLGDGFTLNDDYVFDLGVSVLEAVRTILDANGWCIRVSGSGLVTVAKLPDEKVDIPPSHVMTSYGWKDGSEKVPNRYVAMDGMRYGEAVNDDPNSPASTVSRGYIRDIDGFIDTSPMLAEDESLSAYCMRRLKELSIAQSDYSYEREYMDGVLPYSMVELPMCVGRVVSQDITCSNGLSVRETCRVEESLWL